MINNTNIVSFPRAPVTRINQHRFNKGDRAAYFCKALNRVVPGTIIDIQMDPLSGGQWRVLLLTDCIMTWRDVGEVRSCQ